MTSISARPDRAQHLPGHLQQAMAAFLLSLPNLDTSAGQRALIFQAGFDAALHAQLAFGLPAAQFVQLLIPAAWAYGNLRDGRPALEAVLTAARENFGQNRQIECDALLRDARSHWAGLCPVNADSAPQSPGQAPSEILVCSRPLGARPDPGARGAYLDLTGLFDERFPRSAAYWQREIPQRVDAFFHSARVTQLAQPILLFFDCHLSIAFLTGHLMNPKFGIQIIPMQKTRMSGYDAWPEPARSAAGLWTMDISGTIDAEVIVSIAVTNPLDNHVQPFLHAARLETVPHIRLRPVAGIGPRAIEHGAAAWHLGFELQTLLRGALPAACQRLHLFVSAPAAFAYILGNTLRYITPAVQLYEHDFEGSTGIVRYYPGICLPVARA